MKSLNCFMLLFMFVPSLNGLSRWIRGRPRGGMLGAPRADRRWTESLLPHEQWLVQKLDHFRDEDTRAWKQRYFVNNEYYKPGGPVFLMIGGEGTANPIWMVAGAWIKYAAKYSALCVMLEHRFYGKSHPTEDLSTDNLQYLSSEQALADLAYFRKFIQTEWKLPESAKWIAFGGSYPGSLAAWFRLKYPHLVDASVATSAPVQAKLDFMEYLGVVSDALSTTGNTCVKAVEMATSMLKVMVQSPYGSAYLKKHFRLCDAISNSNKLDVANFFSILTDNFNGVVQYNKDNRAFEGAVGTNVTIDVLCKIMNDRSYGNELQRYAAVNSLMMKTYGQKCLDFKYANLVSDLKQTSWNSSAGEGGRQWTYQTCTEFGFFQSSDLTNQPFGHMFPASFSVKQCQDVFGDKFNEDLIKRGIERTNLNYGGFGIKVTKVVFPNGSIDPWHALGITRNISSEAQAIYIKGTAHCANMYPASDSDPPQLVTARNTIDNLIGQWLSEKSLKFHY